VGALQRSIDEIERRHEALRTTFPETDEVTQAIPYPPSPLPLSHIDLRGLSRAEQDARSLELAHTEAKRPYDLSAGPLLRATLLTLGDEEHTLMLSYHRLVCDERSLSDVFCKELAALYGAFTKGGASPLPELDIQYSDFAAWQRRDLASGRLDPILDFWKEQLASAPPALMLPVGEQSFSAPPFGAASVCRALPGELVEALHALSQREGTSLFVILLAAFASLLHRYTAQEEILIGTTAAGRDHPSCHMLIGRFAHTLALRTSFAEGERFIDVVHRLNAAVDAALAHRELPFDALHQLTPVENAPQLQAMFALEAERPVYTASGLTLTPSPLVSEVAEIDLSLVVRAGAHAPSTSLVYRADRFSAETMERLLSHFHTLLEGAVRQPEQQITAIAILTEEERRKLLLAWNDTSAEYPAARCLHELFEEQVERTPDAVALVFGDERLSYRELDRRANRLAHHLRAHGVGPEVLVGLFVKRSLELVLGILGVLKAGGAYVPLDPDHPRERVAFMLKDASVSVLLTQERLVGHLPEHPCHRLCLDTSWEVIARESPTPPVSGVVPHNLAYIIYTSGSTGKPKGVMIPHGGLVNYLYWCTRAYGIAEGTGAPVHSSIGFDLTITTLFSPLLVGRKVVLTPNIEGVEALLEGVRGQADLSIVKLTPAHLDVIHRLPSAKDVARCARVFVIGGEALSWEALSFFRANAPSARVINEYGPTETVVGCCVYEPSIDKEAFGPVPIGRPIANTRAYVLDQRLQPTPIGVSGELYIGGAGVARGYLHRADWTATRFLPDPFSDEPGARIYRTGDLCRWRIDGELEFLGRLDHQVKVRGYRIELGEIESIVRQCPGVRDAIVVVRQDAPSGDTAEQGHKRLVAYVTQDPSHEPPAEQAADWNTEHVVEWESLYNDTYAEGTANNATTFNLSGWDSSFTGKPIPTEEMQEWRDRTVERILSLRAEHVFEIGCGTGLLLQQVAPRCSTYLGTDFSGTVISYLTSQVAKRGLSQVKLARREAKDFTDLAPQSFDLVILNSVLMYFPSIDYLSDVLEGAVERVADGGTVFVGDVRSLPLLDAFHTAVQLFKAPSDLQAAALLERVRHEEKAEEELIVDPGYFRALCGKLPRVTHVEVLLKRGRYENEMARYRFDVLLYVGGAPEPRPLTASRNFRECGGNLSAVERWLHEEHPEAAELLGVPNARVRADSLAAQRLETATGSVMELKARAAADAAGAVHPEALWSLGERLGYRVRMTYSRTAPDFMDVLFERAEPEGRPRPWLTQRCELDPSPRAYANDPLHAKRQRRLSRALRAFAREKLPDYMVPEAFVFMDAFPLTSNGKVDRSALPSPNDARLERSDAIAMPRSASEETIAAIWCEVFGIERVGIHDDFLELGGYSLVAARIVARIRESLGLELSLREVLEARTIANMARVIEALGCATEMQLGNNAPSRAMEEGLI